MVTVCQHYFTLFVKIIFSGVDGQFKRNGGFYLEVSGSEELVGEITGDDGVGLRGILLGGELNMNLLLKNGQTNRQH